MCDVLPESRAVDGPEAPKPRRSVAGVTTRLSIRESLRLFSPFFLIFSGAVEGSA